jgi:hypothetical protein
MGVSATELRFVHAMGASAKVGGRCLAVVSAARTIRNPVADTPAA